MNKTMAERFLEKIERKSSGCWEWTRFRNPQGYGIFQVCGRAQLSHRISYELFSGEIPEGLCVLHRCDNPPCVNPSHLFLGTRQDNNADCKAKGRCKSGKQKLTVDQVKEIRSYPCYNDEAMEMLSKKYNITKAHTVRISQKKAWPALA